jgi:hypothetical protein
MSRTGRIAVAIAAIGLLWAGFTYTVSRPADAVAYARTMVQVAESAHDSARTGRLTAEQKLGGRVTSPFAQAAFDDAAKGLAGAQKKFAAEAPPDAASARLRDQLSPLLAAEVTALGDTTRADGDAALRAGMARLDALAQHLDDFITANR